MDRECLICGKSFIPLEHNVRKGHGKYCSRSCASKLRLLINPKSRWISSNKPKGDK
jgi:hypothetical protein